MGPCPYEWRKRDPIDYQRPPFPYNEKQCLSIRRHTPLEPFGLGYAAGTGPTAAFPGEVIKLSQHEWVLQHPIAETRPHPDQTVHRLYLIDGIDCKDQRGAQIVRCRLDNQKRGRIYVAKIYDALYYAFADPFDFLPVDVTWLADHDYCREAAVYEELKRGGVDGKFAPKYYGSWTFDTELEGVMRPVRLILSEWIKGTDLQIIIDKGEKHLIRPKVRLEILAQALELECTIRCHNVTHIDFAPRNVMLVGFNARRQTFARVVLIDFGESIVQERDNSVDLGVPVRKRLPQCPRYCYWRCLPTYFKDWIPKPHRYEPDVFKGWLKSRWDNTNGFARPNKWSSMCNNFDEPVKMVEPEEDD